MKKSTAATVDILGPLYMILPIPYYTEARKNLKGGKNVIEIAYSEKKFDQWRLSKVGGVIVIGVNGKPRFRFNHKEQFEYYCRLNDELEGMIE